MAFDRSKFVAPKLETNKKVTDEVNKIVIVSLPSMFNGTDNLMS